jgi:hypothetical protein
MYLPAGAGWGGRWIALLVCAWLCGACWHAVGPASSDSGSAPPADAAGAAEDAGELGGADAMVAAVADAGSPSGPDAGIPKPFAGSWCSRDGWCWEMPLPHGDSITGLAGSGSEVWATTAGGRILHKWLGAWSVDLQQYGRFSRLRAGAPNDIWAGSNSSALHFDGAQWSRLVSPPWGFASFWPASPTDVWALAWPQSQPPSALYRFDGASWNPVNFPPAPTYVLDVHGRSANDVWIAYHWASGNLAHWDGQAFSDLTPSQTETYSRVWADLDAVWALSCSQSLARVYRRSSGA